MNTMSPIRPLARTSRIVNESRSVRRQLHANARPADAVHAAAHPALPLDTDLPHEEIAAGIQGLAPEQLVSDTAVPPTLASTGG